MSLPVSPFGQLALMVEVADPAEARAFAAAVRRSPARGQVDVVPAETSVLVTFDIPGRLDAATTHFATLTVEPGESLTGRTVEIPTIYDGEDLASVAEALGMSVAEVLEAHQSQTWTAAFTGFAPGFAYLTAEPNAADPPPPSHPTHLGARRLRRNRRPLLRHLPPSLPRRLAPPRPHRRGAVEQRRGRRPH